jgi:hypothetical protein
MLTMKTYRYINRGLFERDKITFKLMVCTRVMLNERRMQSTDL